MEINITEAKSTWDIFTTNVTVEIKYQDNEKRLSDKCAKEVIRLVMDDMNANKTTKT